MKRQTVTCERLLVSACAVLVWIGGCGAYSEAGRERPESSDAADGMQDGTPDASSSSSDTEASDSELATGTDPEGSDTVGPTTPACSDGVTETPEPSDADASCSVASMPCGGDVVGRWRALGCPIELTGEVNLSGFGLGCVGAPITSGSLEVSGIWTADEDGNVCDTTITTGTQEFEVPSTCFEVGIVVPCARLGAPLSSLGYDALACVDNPETGGCTCTAAFTQRGGLGAIARAPVYSGHYSVTGTLLTTADEGHETTTYEHCVMDDTLVLRFAEPSDIGELEGSIVLQKR